MLGKDKDNKEKLIGFFLVDFKDISEKLESTDKKVQFCTQLYITLISAVLAAIGSGLLKQNNSYTGSITLYSAILLVIFYIIGQFVLCYMLSGQKIHTEYVNRLNTLRRLILENSGKHSDFIDSYGYTQKISPKWCGMNYFMIYLIFAVMLIFLIIASFCMKEYSQNICCFILCISITCIILILNIIGIRCHHCKMKR